MATVETSTVHFNTMSMYGFYNDSYSTEEPDVRELAKYHIMYKIGKSYQIPHHVQNK